MGVDADANERVIGLTRARIGHSATITVVGIEEPRSRRVCVRPEIRIELSLAPMTVFVGREFRGDDCRRAVIIEHELKHVAVYREMQEAMAREARDEITRAYGNTAMEFASRDEAQREIEAALSGYLGPLLERSTREVRQRQAAVDTPAEYARVAGACGGIAVARVSPARGVRMRAAKAREGPPPGDRGRPTPRCNESRRRCGRPTSERVAPVRSARGRAPAPIARGPRGSRRG